MKKILLSALLAGFVAAPLVVLPLDGAEAQLSLVPPKQNAAPAPSAAGQKPAPNAAPVQKVTLAQINSYFNALTHMTSDFSQVTPEGKRYTGKLYLSRPGKMRFEYAPPSPLEIVADGRSVAVRDRKLNTQDLYLISQTPLKFLLSERIDLGRDLKVLSLNQLGQQAELSLEDKSTVGGTSQIKLVFRVEPMLLKQWTVTDPQGTETTVDLSNIDTARRPDARQFVIDEQRILQ